MQFIFLITVAFATHGVFATSDVHINIPSEKVFDDVVQEEASLRAENGHDEAVLDLAQLLKVMHDNHKLLPIKDDTNVHNKGAIIQSLEEILEEILKHRNNMTEENRMQYDDDEESDWREIKSGDDDEMINLGVIKVVLMPSDTKSDTDTVGIPFRDNNARTRNRSRRLLTQGGYTHDQDTCQTYNDNLQKLWDVVSKYLTTSDAPSKKALHNIAIIVQAYLDHQHNKDTVGNFKSETEIQEDKSVDPVDEIISKIQKILINDNTNPVESIYVAISKELKENSNFNKDCSNLNEEYLRTSIDLAYQNYLENASCNDGESKALRQKVPGSDYIFVSNKIKVTPADDINGKVGGTGDLIHPIKKREPNKNSQMSKIQKAKLVVDLYGDYIDENTDNTPQRSLFAESTLLRSNHECQQVASRKFINSIRSVIERFMNRSECKFDATLRTSNIKSVYQSNLNRDSESSLVSPFKITGNNIFQEFRESNEYNTNTMLNHKNPMNNLYDSRNNKEDVTNDGVNTLLLKLRDLILTGNKVPQPPLMKKINTIPKASNYDTASLFNGITNPYEQAHLNQYSNWKNNIYVTPAEANYYATTPKTIKYNTHPYQQEDNVNLYHLLYEDLLQRNLQENENEQNIKKKILGLLNFSNNNDKQTTGFNEPGFLNKRFKKISKRSIDFRSMGEIRSNFNQARNSYDKTGYVDTYHIKHPKVDIYQTQFVIKSKIPDEDSFHKEINLNVTDNEIEILKALKHYLINFKPTEVIIDNDEGKPLLKLYDILNKENKNVGKSVVNINNVPSAKDILVFNYHDGHFYLDNSQDTNNGLNGFKSEKYSDESESETGSESGSESNTEPNQSYSDSGTEEDDDVYDERRRSQRS